MSEKTFRLEFKQKTQWLRLSNRTHEENTNGFITIFEHCTDLECDFFYSFLTCENKEILTNEYVLRKSKECKNLLKNLTEYQITIKYEYI